MSLYQNPFPEANIARHAIWQMLVTRVIEAFVQKDWSVVADDFITDLDNWGRFNTVYAHMLPEPRPVRTAVQTPLLPGLLVEVEMWAAPKEES